MSQGKVENLTGKQFGMLTVLYRAEDYIQPSGQHKRMWHCRCECGNECDVRASDLKTGNTKSCGCFQQYSRGKYAFEDLTGKVFGRLTVAFRLPNHITASGQTKTMWHCICSCGKECDVYTSQLKSGKDSCGCLNVEKREQRKMANKNRKKEERLLNLKRKQEEKLLVLEKKKEEKQLKSIDKKKRKRKEYLKGNSLAVQCPELLNEWDYDKNTISPNEVTVSSAKIA